MIPANNSLPNSGMFLYARLVFDYIEHNIFYNSDEIKSSVNELPKTISDL